MSIQNQVEAAKVGVQDDELEGEKLTDQKRRHQAWLRRGKDAKSKTCWRPKKLNRVAARKWVQVLDNQLRWTTGRGLEQFLCVPALEWDRWPHLSVGIDLGSDGNTGFHGLERWLLLNIDLWNDGSHGCNRDFSNIVNALGLWGFALCLMLSMNLPHGPRDTGERRWELRSSLAGLYESGVALEEVVLFMASSARIVQNLKAMGVEFNDDEPEYSQAWK